MAWRLLHKMLVPLSQQRSRLLSQLGVEAMSFPWVSLQALSPWTSSPCTLYKYFVGPWALLDTQLEVFQYRFGLFHDVQSLGHRHPAGVGQPQKLGNISSSQVVAQDHSPASCTTRLDGGPLSCPSAARSRQLPSPPRCPAPVWWCWRSRGDWLVERGQCVECLWAVQDQMHKAPAADKMRSSFQDEQNAVLGFFIGADKVASPPRPHGSRLPLLLEKADEGRLGLGVLWVSEAPLGGCLAGAFDGTGGRAGQQSVPLVPGVGADAAVVAAAEGRRGDLL